jgi:hypothetical protein
MDLLDRDEEPDENEPEAALPNDDFSEEEPEPRDHLPNIDKPWSETLMQAHAAGTRMSMNSLALMPMLTYDRAEMQRQLEAATDENERVELRGVIEELDKAIDLAKHGKPQMPLFGGHARP